MAKASRRHHFIPRAILKRFADERQQFYYFQRDGDGGTIEVRNIRSAFYEKDYYNFVDEYGKRDDRAEKLHFAEIDREVSIFVDKIEDAINNGRLPRLDRDASLFLRDFIYSYHKRTPDSLSKIPDVQNPKTLIEAELDSLPDRCLPLSEEKRRGILSEEGIDRIARHARIGAQTVHAPEIVSIMSGMKHVFAICQAQKSFVIGSNPVLRFENKATAVLGDGVELWTPFSEKLYVGLVDGDAEIDSVVRLSDFLVRRLNERQVKVSSSAASKSLKLLESLTKSKLAKFKK